MGSFAPQRAQRLASRRSLRTRRLSERGSTSPVFARLDALLIGHTHYDHALDDPFVAKETDAL